MNYSEKDIRPTGLNNFNQLVYNQLGESGFEVVRILYNNIQWLHALYSQLPNVSEVGNSLYIIKGLEQYLGDIVNVAHASKDIQSLNENLTLIKDLAPRIQDFKKSLDELNCKINKQDYHIDDLLSNADAAVYKAETLLGNLSVQINKASSSIEGNLKNSVKEYTKAFSDLLSDMKKMHAEVQSVMPVLKQVIANQNQTNKVLAHLTASDVVTQYLSSKTVADYKAALKAIIESEKFENDETLNRARINAPSSSSVLNALRKNKIKSVTQGGCNA